MDTPRRLFRLAETRVGRVYTGGALLDKFLGRRVCEDSYCPENWIGSDTEALGGRSPGEGLSLVGWEGRRVPLRDLLAAHPKEFLGEEHIARFGSRTGILVKELDSLVRLPIQAHPDRAFSRARLGSPFGKTETWYVVDCREVDGMRAHIYLGFSETASPAAFRRCYDAQDVPGMLAMLNKVEIRPGDFFVIPGRVPHAIGPGVFCVETQEPTDFVFQLDKKGPCWDLTPAQVHMGLGDDAMFDSFEFDGPRGAAALAELHRHIDAAEGSVDLLGGSFREFFRCDLVAAESERAIPNDSFAIAIILEGEGVISFDGGSEKARKGDAFAIPRSLERLFLAPAGSRRLVVHVSRPAAQETKPTRYAQVG